ncbi:hypothetical protein [Iodidimonas sp. SYSU 1G8]|uniref:hypothetical protein n=1 Tax=Iodidimonas sp. SYSU 1G8 TaxID=3133967 RepID=UPI0031FEEB03
MILLTEGVYSVWVTRKVKEAVDALDVQPRARLQALFNLFCQNGPRGLNAKTQFPSEDAHPSGLKNMADIALRAFKPAAQWRLYGTVTTYKEKPAFIGVAVDDSKKQDKADQHLLKLAAKRAARIIDVDRKPNLRGKGGKK